MSARGGSGAAIQQALNDWPSVLLPLAARRASRQSVLSRRQTSVRGVVLRPVEAAGSGVILCSVRCFLNSVCCILCRRALVDKLSILLVS